MVKKTVFLYWIIQKIFYQKSGRVRGLRISVPNFWPKISKIVWQEVWELATVHTMNFLRRGLTVGENCNVLIALASTSVLSKLFKLNKTSNSLVSSSWSIFWHFLCINSIILHHLSFILVLNVWQKVKYIKYCHNLHYQANSNNLDRKIGRKSIFWYFYVQSA